MRTPRPSSLIPARSWELTDSAQGSPSHAQVVAFLGEIDEPDWKDERSVEEWAARHPLARVFHRAS